MTKYKMVQVKNHPILGTCRIYQHRLVMTNKLGRKLAYNEYVHHKDHDKGNNCPRNLKLKSPKQHSAEHLLGKHRPKAVRQKISLAQKGRQVPESRRLKMSIAHLGEKWDDERRRNHAKGMRKWSRKYQLTKQRAGEQA